MTMTSCRDIEVSSEDALCTCQCYFAWFWSVSRDLLFCFTDSSTLGCILAMSLKGWVVEFLIAFDDATVFFICSFHSRALWIVRVTPPMWNAYILPCMLNPKESMSSCGPSQRCAKQKAEVGAMRVEIWPSFGCLIILFFYLCSFVFNMKLNFIF